MIQCKDCEFYETTPQGQKMFKCDPFENIKEPECLTKWEILKINLLLANYQGMLRMQQKMAPMQDKIFKYVERELSDIEEADGWKYNENSDDDIDSEDEFYSG